MRRKNWWRKVHSWELGEEKSGRLKWNRREPVKKEYGILGNNREEEFRRKPGSVGVDGRRWIGGRK